MGERSRIVSFFAPLTAGEAGSFYLTDDAAIITPPAGQQLVITTDSVIETIHVLPGAEPHQFATKLMRRNLSDLAAMGATPWRYTLNIHTPVGLPDSWFEEFAAALASEQKRFSLVLIGGDSTAGDAHIHTTVTCYGLIDGDPLRRNGAKVGDDLYISGALGGASYALHLLQQFQPVSDALAARYHAPEPRLALGTLLRTVASAALDVTDGLLADITRICEASGCGATIQRDAIPLQPELIDRVAEDECAWRFALSGGDDHELCFTAAPEKRKAVEAIAANLQHPLTRIGSIIAGHDIQLLDANGSDITPTHRGWEHG